MEVTIYRCRTFVVLVLTWVNIVYFLTFHECLFINNKIKYSTEEPPRSGFLRSAHLPRPDMIFYEILTNITYTGIGENISTIKNKRN